MSASPPLGWIEPQFRTPEQHAAHAMALAAMPRFALAPPANTGPVKVILTDFWFDPVVVADVGLPFTGFRQFTGSCIGVSEGNAIFTLAAIQRRLTTGATQAFIPWWPFPYGRTRYNEGDRGQGEGAINSVMGETLRKEGVFACTEPGLPAYDTSDGFALTADLEMQWSDGGSQTVLKWQDVAKQHPLGTAAPIYSTADIKTAILNGYPVYDGCENYVGNGAIKHSGSADAYVQGHYDGRGGHSTCFLSYWDHPQDGPLFGYSNQWAGNTYPKDPGGLGRCCVWLTEKEVAKLFHTGGSDGETLALSHLSYFPAQVEQILDYYE